MSYSLTKRYDKDVQNNSMIRGNDVWQKLKRKLQSLQVRVAV